MVFVDTKSLRGLRNIVFRNGLELSLTPQNKLISFRHPEGLFSLGYHKQHLNFKCKIAHIVTIDGVCAVYKPRNSGVTYGNSARVHKPQMDFKKLIGKTINLSQIKSLLGAYTESRA